MRQPIEQLIASGDVKTALVEIETFLDTSRDRGGAGGDLSWAWRKKAQCLFMLGRLPDAIRSGQEAVRTAQDLGDTLAEAEAENTIGIVHGELGDLEQTVQHLERSFRLHRKLGTNRVATVLNNMGNTCLIMNDLERAFGYFEKALAEAQGHEDLREVEGTARANLGRACLALGRTQEAVGHLQQSIEHFREHGMETLRLHAVTKLAAVYEASGDADAAESCYQEALAATVGEQEPTVWQHEIHGSLARLLVEQGRYDEAEPHFLKAFRMTSEAHTSFDLAYLRKDYSTVLENDSNIVGALNEMRTAFEELDRQTERKIEKQLYQAMGRFEIERIEHEKELYRLRNEELAAALSEVEKLRDTLEERNRKLSELVIRDPLTATFNRRWFFSALDTEIDRSRRQGRPVSVALIDLDHFKAVNDSYGHAVGDDILVAASTILMQATRKTDDVARYGGEEFGIIMPDTDSSQALIVCEKLRKRFNDHDWSFAGGVTRITFSGGIACITELPVGTVTPAKDLLERADHRLYEAKELGRNRIVSPS
ncbi:MAG: diguanylate cyclase [Spirochaetaceae bacterium]